MAFIGVAKSITVHPNSIVITKENLYDTPRLFPKYESIINLSKNIHKNKMSQMSIGKCKRSINYLLLNSQQTHNYSRLDWRNLNFKIAFITLTLSAKQKHSDNYIKAKMLNHFLIEAKRLWDVTNYVWRSEKQLNGNIHFHILVDKFIPHYELRSVWNNIQNKCGYIADYRTNMLEFHKNGFTPNNKLFDTWSLNNQIKAYQKGKSSNWSNPNSTDIHSVRLINNVAAYCTKYMTKGSKNKISRISRSSISYTKSHIKGTRSLSDNVLKYLRSQSQIGRLWGCSIELSNLKGNSEIIDSSLSREVDIISRDNRVKQISDNWCTVLSCNIEIAIELHCTNLVYLLSEYMVKHFIFHDYT